MSPGIYLRINPFHAQEEWSNCTYRQKICQFICKKNYETNERERIVHETSAASMWNDNFFVLISRFIWNSTAFTRKQWNVVFNVSLNYECPLSIDIHILRRQSFKNFLVNTLYIYLSFKWNFIILTNRFSSRKLKFNP